MPDVKRRIANRQPYRSALRAEQARQTRLRILDAASGLFAKRGYVAVTMDAIAAAAGVAVDTVYATFGTKRGLLSALIDQGVVGPDVTGPVLQQEGPQAVFRERDARRQLAMFAADIATRIERVRPLDDILQIAAAVDGDAAELRTQLRESRYANVRGFAAALAGNDGLRDELTIDDAATVVWTLTSSEVNRLLRDVRGLSLEDYVEWLSDTLKRTLLR
jgi:AcrR family transcriptional regulator